MGTPLAADSTQFNAPNYIGPLFRVGNYNTQFLRAVGGENPQERAAISTSYQFPLNQQYSLSAAAQPSITENASLTAPTANTYVRSQETNVCQIYHEQVSISYQKLAQTGLVSGLANVDGTQPVADEMAFQIKAALEQIAFDMDYTFLNGTYQLGSDTTTAFQTRGIITAVSTNSQDASSAALAKSHVDALMVDMFTNGARLGSGDIAIFCGAFQKQALGEIFGLQERKVGVGGNTVNTLITDVDEFPVFLSTNIPAGTILWADMSLCRPVFVNTPGKGLLFVEDLSRSGAGEDKQIFGVAGLDYGFEEAHGKIINLATS